MGDSYPNRSDLRAPFRAQPTSSITPHARPGATPAAARGTASASSGAQGAVQPAIGPGDVPSLEEPTLLPNQPVTAGLPIGPGAGPGSLNVIADDNPELSILRHLYARFPNADLRRLIGYLEAEA